MGRDGLCRLLVLCTEKLVWSVQMLVLVYAGCSVPLLWYGYCQPLVLTGTCTPCAPGVADWPRGVGWRRHGGGGVGYMSEI